MAQDAPPAKRRPGLRAWIMPVVALGLLAWLMHRYDGIGVIKKVADQLGWRWLLLIPPWSAIALITIMAYRTALPGRGRAIPFWVLLQIERSGSALNALLPLGNNSSHIIKVGLLRHWFSSESIVAAAVWCAMATGNANAFGAIGPLICLALGFGETWAVGVLAATAVLMAIPTLLILSLVRKGLAARVMRLVSKLPGAFVSKRREKWRAWAERLDTHLASAVGERRGDYARLLGFRFLGQTIRVLELWMVVELLDLPGGILTAVLYNATSRAVEQLAPFIPGRLGVMEGVSMAVFASLGLTGEAGLQMALTLRIRYFVNLIVSYSALTRLDALAQKYPARSEAEREGKTPPALESETEPETP